MSCFLICLLLINKEIASSESKIIEIMLDIDSPTASIPGISFIIAAAIISQSGTKAFKGKMVKRGSSHLRYVLMNVVKTVCIHNDTMK